MFPHYLIFIWLFIVLTGIGYILNPDFSFVKIAAPYAQVKTVLWPVIVSFFVIILCNTHASYMFILQELLDVRQKRRTGPQLVEEIRKQADDVPYLIWNSHFSFPFQMIFLYNLKIRCEALF